MSPSGASREISPRLVTWVCQVVGARGATLERLRGGGNNRVYRVSHPGGTCVLKHYFRDPRDGRSRRGRETAFLRFCEAQAVGGVPRVLAEDPELEVALHEFAPGAPPRPDQPTAALVRQIGAFLVALNRERNGPQALALPDASEACFSPRDHIHTVERRLDRLRMAVDALPPDVGGFVSEQLLPYAGPLIQKVQQSLAGLDADRALTPRERVLSPSDIGLHNALVTEDGQLTLVDFEYAGWDDPAKLVGDLHGHIDAGLPVPLLASVMADLASVVDRPAEMLARARALLPLHHLKWCAIALTALLPVDAARRAFAGADETSRAAVQLAKARRHLERLVQSPPGNEWPT